MNTRRIFTLITFLPVGVAALSSCSSSPRVEGDVETVTNPSEETSSGVDGADAAFSGEIVFPPQAGDAGEAPLPCSEDAGNCYVDYDAGPACGDGVVNPGEECDDGNSLAGDGCNGACNVEPFFDCGDAGTDCVFTLVCGDGQLDPGEICDDKNQTDDDGCSADCTLQDPSFVCAPGKPCQRLYECGDSRVNGSDECDDGNTASNDGCSDECKLEEGYRCPAPGNACVQKAECGNQKRETGEQCDDGDRDSGDGCAENCRLEKDWACNADGECRYTPECGDGVVSGAEICDDGNTTSGDGCSDECTSIDEGYTCERPGFGCRTVCGDGIIAGAEQCDDENTTPGDGCGERCRLEANTVCEGEPSECRDTVCGNYVKEGTEPCDDGNQSWGDGCTPECQIEPSCAVGAACVSECGDGIKFPSEDCDDGNAVDGDGCSAVCEIEEGFTCSEATGSDTIVMPMIVRDFVGSGTIPLVSGITSRHLDFEWPTASTFGMEYGLVTDTLGADKKPVFAYNGSATANTEMGNCPQAWGEQVRNNVTYCANFVQNADSFERWYSDVDAYNNTYQQQLILRLTGDTFVYDSETHRADGTAYAANERKGFWPLEDVPDDFKARQCAVNGVQGPLRNFHFTSEVHHWFQYDAAAEATLTFTGDDDVFVFIAGKLVLDLGGIHARSVGSVTLTTTGDAIQDRPTGDNVNVDLNLEDGKIYEIIVFQAERNTCESNYRLELENFNLAKSVCVPRCGDGFVTADEECDDGEDNTETPEYGKCTKNSCTLGPFCGDKQKNGDEACDNGVNTSGWGDDDADACAPGCKAVPVCGDGTVDPGFEDCDNGGENVADGYGECTTQCTTGEFCGDGETQEDQGESCDDGVNDGQYGSCTAECGPGPRCGDGETQAEWGEQCDGEENCSDNCRLGAQCGDAIVQEDLGEECDDGENLGGYGQCGPSCLRGPRCGDEVVQRDREQCDDGVNNGGYGECAPGCRLGDRCGDNVVQAEQGEQCDDGNSRANDGCSPTCRRERRGDAK